jgi:hypothetical protein
MSMYAIASSTVTTVGGTASITFSSIPQTFTHLQLRSFCRSTAAVGTGNILAEFNGDTGSNYTRHIIQADGGSVVVAAAVSAASASVGGVVGTSAASNTFEASISDILDYSSTNRNKTSKDLRGCDYNGAGIVAIYSSSWMNTSALTSIRIFPASGNFDVGSRFDLYGVSNSPLSGA